MNQNQRQQVKRYINIFLRRKFLIILCFCIGVIVGVVVYLKTPKVYLSSSLIMYQQKINPTQMSPDQSRFQEVVGTVTQQITSRSSLENLINQFKLYPDLRARYPMEDVVAIMRERAIKIRPDRRGSNIIEVSYQGRAPRSVLLVTNALAAKFIEENIRLREETVSETSAYIKDELNMSKEALNKKESAMRDYKLKYYNEMPDHLQINVSRLNALQGQYQSYQNNLQDLERTKILLQEQINLRKADLLARSVDDDFNSLADFNQKMLSDANQLANLKNELNILLIRYTDKHPDVKRLQSIIAQLEKDSESDNADPNSESESDLSEIEASDRILLQLINQVDDINYNIDKLRKGSEETLVQIEKYTKWIEAVPVREAEWSDLTRDYEQLSKHYHTLVGRDLLADSAQSLERRQKGSQFKIVDPAHFPENPYKPDFFAIMLMAIGISLGVGGGFAFALELLDTSFRDAHDLENFLDLPVACSIPVIRTAKEKRFQYIKSAIWLSIFILTLTILGGGIAFLWYKGTIII